ncbi:MAG: hypothetical protein KF880_00060 [Ferruginibacter sp.]|nr:hypothetical protein [Ferruginibacter sp.]
MYYHLIEYIKGIIRQSIKAHKNKGLLNLLEQVIEDVKKKQILTDKELEAAKQIASEMINNHIK